MGLEPTVDLLTLPGVLQTPSSPGLFAGVVIWMILQPRIALGSNGYQPFAMSHVFSAVLVRVMGVEPTVGLSAHRNLSPAPLPRFGHTRID